MYGINNIRFGGIASGLDTESIIKDLMRIENMKVDRNRQQKQLLEWKRDDYRSLNNQLRSFREGANWNLKLQSTFMAKKATTTDDTVFKVTATNKAAPGNYTFEVKQLASGVTVEGFPAQSIQEFFGAGEEPVSFSFRGAAGEEAATVTVNKTDTMADVVSKVNALSSSTGVKALYDEGINAFFLYTDKTGENVQIEITDDKSGFLGGVLGIKDPQSATGDPLGPVDGSIDQPVLMGQGTNAVVNFNDIDLQFAANKFEFIGMNFDLKKPAPGEKVYVQINNDTDKVVDEIKAFVEAYNKIVDDIGTKLSEKRYRDFPPLTDEQKEDMKEKDIEKWEEKARSGIFRADSLLSQIASTLRMTVSDPVSGLEGKYKTLSSLGIQTSPDWKDNGKLYINEDDLRKALSEDLDGVAKLFNNADENDPKKQGITQKLDTQIKSFYEQVASTAGRPTVAVDQSYLGKQISGLEKSIEDMQDRMYRLEEKYWNQFTAMEKALQQMQSQSDWLMAQIGGMQQ